MASVLWMEADWYNDQNPLWKKAGVLRTNSISTLLSLRCKDELVILPTDSNLENSINQINSHMLNNRGSADLLQKRYCIQLGSFNEGYHHLVEFMVIYYWLLWSSWFWQSSGKGTKQGVPLLCSHIPDNGTNFCNSFQEHY